jgi:AraC-like DNA-binding protein
MDISMVRGDKNFFDTMVCALSQASLRPLCIKRACRLDLELFSANSSYHTIKGVCRLKAVGAEFLSLLFDSIVSDDRDIYSKRETSILIDNMINLPGVSLDDIARATNYSKRHVSRLIKEKYGASLGKIKKQIRNGGSANGK